MTIDTLFRRLCFTCAILLPVLLLCIFASLAFHSTQAWKTFGFSFLFSTDWDPMTDKYGAFPSIVGTLATTGIAMIIAVPLSFMTAFYLSDIPRHSSAPLSAGLDLLAAIPSVIYGMWGLFVLVPFMQTKIQPFIVHTLHLKNCPLIGGEYNGFGCFTAGIVLALMVIPFISAMMRDVFMMTPPLLKESAMGIGCTRWETARDIVMRYGLRGLVGAVFIGLGRALGETMAVLFIIGNTMTIPKGIFGSGTTIAATLANHFAEADGLLKSVLFALGIILLILSFTVQILTQYFLNRAKAKRGER